ncbi:AprI/Inh family metalloprotease inhibitor [Candidatus Liberibacter sp.]|uniref:AprI/Inh family metalloprotease inhibitor n=1 Tax=Candidatus Liberibacter sp. TaxID=34022 RepID=UPI0015F45390|nr:AprI/Inh family metalloprotease inhibitor [Candidatus Liberibacter sp.]MBA5724167.1 AprI/Inh family metalloprotease inhibitor [Candidatus Liberibacter sp.]
MQFFRFVFLVFYTLSFSGCVDTFFASKVPLDSAPKDSEFSIRSEPLPPPLPSNFNEHGFLEKGKDKNKVNRLMIGMWNISVHDTQCNLILTLTKLNRNFRAATQGCYGKLALLASWHFSDDRLELKNRKGDNIIVLQKITDKYFEGTFKGEESKVSINRG